MSYRGIRIISCALCIFPPSLPACLPACQVELADVTEARRLLEVAMQQSATDPTTGEGEGEGEGSERGRDRQNRK